MPLSNGRPLNRKPKKWRIKMREFPFNPTTTWPYLKKDNKGKQEQIISLEITKI